MTEIKRILLVEDNPRDVELTLTALEEGNILNRVAIARDGAAALDFLQSCQEAAPDSNELPALVLLNLKLPKLSGLEVLARIKANRRLASIPVVMLTSSPDDPDLKCSQELGVNAYVVKPLDLHQFIVALKQACASWAVLDQRPSQKGLAPG